MRTVRIRADHENNAELFWQNLRANRPEIADLFRMEDEVEISSQTWEEIQKIEGFGDGPAYARDALIVRP